MRQGFIKVGVSTPEVYVADCQANAEAVWKRIQEMQKSGVKIMVFPELCLTGYTCSDLFLQDRLLNEAAVQLENYMNKDGTKCWLTINYKYPY